MSMTPKKFDLINNTASNCIHLLIDNQPKYFNNFNVNSDDFFIDFDETIIFDIRELIFNKLKKTDKTSSIYSIIDNTLDYLLESDKALFINHFRFKVNKMFNYEYAEQ